MEAGLLEIAKNNKKIFLILGMPEMNIDPRKYYIRSNLLDKNNLKNDDRIRLSLNSHKIKNYQFLKAIENIKNENIYIFDPASVLCNKLDCYSIQDNKILYRDNSHISKKNSYVLYNDLYNFLTIE